MENVKLKINVGKKHCAGLLPLYPDCINIAICLFIRSETEVLYYSDSVYTTNFLYFKFQFLILLISALFSYLTAAFVAVQDVFRPFSVDPDKALELFILNGKLVYNAYRLAVDF